MDAVITALVAIGTYELSGWVFKKLFPMPRGTGAELSYKRGVGWSAEVYVGKRVARRSYPDSYCTEQVLDLVRDEIQDLRSAE